MSNSKAPIDATQARKCAEEAWLERLDRSNADFMRSAPPTLIEIRSAQIAINRSEVEMESLRNENERLQEKVDAITKGEPFLFLAEGDFEKAASELDDPSLAKWARWVCVTATEHYEKFATERGRNVMEYLSTMSIVTLARLVASTGADHAVFSVEGATWTDQKEGQDWRVTIERTDKAALAGDDA